MMLKKIEIDYGDWYLKIQHIEGKVYVSKFTEYEKNDYVLQDHFVIDTEHVKTLINGLKTVTGIETE